MSGPAAAPVSDLTLKPLSVHGLCEAVMTMPHAALRSTTSYETIWVGSAVASQKRPGCRPRADLGRGLGEELAREAPVVADDHAACRRPRVAHVLGHALGAAADVVVRVVLGDARPPAVRAEDDRRRRPSVASRAGRSQVLVLLRLGQPLDDCADLLGTVAAQHEDHVRRVDDDGIAQARPSRPAGRRTSGPARSATRCPRRGRRPPRRSATRRAQPARGAAHPSCPGRSSRHRPARP